MKLAGNSDSDVARTLLKGIPVLQRPCDLDLLVFFARHWRALLSSEQLAELLGYPLKEIARSRDVLVGAGLLTRAQSVSRSERMYVFEPDKLKGGPLPAILTLMSTPNGRLSLRRALKSDTNGDTNDLPAQGAPSPDGAKPKRSRSTPPPSGQPERTQ